MEAVPFDQDRDVSEGLEPSMGHMLLKAFESFINPIIQARMPGIAVDSPPAGPISEGQDLLSALDKYVAALVKQKVKYVSQEGEQGKHLLYLSVDQTSGQTFRRSDDSLLDNSVTSISIPRDLGAAPRSPLLQQALDEMQQYVFNRMPIRLLTYDSDGNGIELIERGEIWRRISASMEAAFDGDTIAAQIRQYQGDGGPSQYGPAKTQAIHDFSAKYKCYAILSHTWLQTMPGEVTYINWKDQQFDKSSPGYQKLAAFCRVAARDYDLSLAWMDTICINKESSSELDESIRSMYNWYQSSAVCITYLAQTLQLDQMHADAWFTRGWTLQELIAPQYMKFYASDWRKIVYEQGQGDDMRDLRILEEIYKATTITVDEFTMPLGKLPISRKMQWAADRRVTREEDTAYSLMGIFGVSFSIAYGEGTERAFIRLVKEILNTNTSGLLDIVNHGYTYDELRPGTVTTIGTSYLIPPSPQQYRCRDKSNIVWYPNTTPLTLTQLGLHVSAMLIPASLTTGSQAHSPFMPKGDYYASVSDIITSSRGGHVSHWNFNLLDKSIFKTSSDVGQNVVVFAVFNISETPTTVSLAPGGLCCAVILRTVAPAPFSGVIPEVFASRAWATAHTLTFEMQKKRRVLSYTINKNDLWRHGMALRTMYL